MLPAATACSNGFHKCVRFFSISVISATRRLPSVLPSRVASSSPAAPPPTITTRCGAGLLPLPAQCAGNTRLPDQRGARDKEGYDGEQRRESKPDQIAAYSLARLASVEVLVAWSRVRSVQPGSLLGVAHVAAPIKYTIVNSATQMMS